MLLQESRARSGMTKKAFAEQVGTSRMALDLIEKGRRVPSIDLANRIAEAGGLRLKLTPAVTATTQASLADHAEGVDITDPVWTWRWLTGDFLSNHFVPGDSSDRAAMLLDPVAPTGDLRWDRFLQALAEHAATHARITTPRWVDLDPDPHDAFWWPVHGSRPSTRAAALAHSPASFARRGILIDGRDLPRITP